MCQGIKFMKNVLKVYEKCIKKLWQNIDKTLLIFKIK